MENKLIFFVDDDKMMLNLMEYTFKCREGFEVRSFFSGEECLDHIFMKPNLIVLDYYLGEGESTGHVGTGYPEKDQRDQQQHSGGYPQP